MYDLSNKVVVVTGGTGILGKKFCKALSEHGAITIVSDLDEKTCIQQAKDIEQQTGVKSFGVALDLTDEKSVNNWYENILTKVNKIDVLVNNAAVKPKGFFESIENYSLQTWNETIAVNITGMFLAIQKVGKHMLSRLTNEKAVDTNDKTSDALQNTEKGNIINISSIYGVVGPDQRIYEGSWYEELGGSINTPLIYSVTKGAVISLTRHLASEWGLKGIRVNAISPGGVASGQNSEFTNKYSQRVPMGRMANVSEIVGALLFLVSDSSSYVNGHNLVVDGGLTAW